MMDTGLVALVLGEMAFLAVLLWLLLPFFRERARLRADLQRAVVERFASGSEFVSFLESDSGRRWQASLAGRGANPSGRVIAGVQTGLVLIFLAVGLGVAGRVLQDDEVLAAALVTVSVGVGFLVAAYASHRLCRAYRLLP
jgi:hypothetical protein